MIENQPERQPEQPEEHPLMKGSLPDWLAEVPMDAKKTTLVPFAKGKDVPLDLVTNALTDDVGVTRGSMAISSELAQLFAEHTENSAWKNLPSEPTSVTRVADDEWKVEVGDFAKTFTREQIEQRVIETLLPVEDQHPKE